MEHALSIRGKDRAALSIKPLAHTGAVNTLKLAMKPKALIVYSRPPRGKVDLLKTTNIDPSQAEIRTCLFFNHQGHQFDYNFNIKENNYSFSALIAAVNSATVSIFDEFIPDFMILTSYDLTAMAAGLAGYFMGVELKMVPIQSINSNQFPTDASLKIINQLLNQNH